jgi:hypothetical protein
VSTAQSDRLLNGPRRRVRYVYLVEADDEQRAEHLVGYGGAGEMPHLLDHVPAPEQLVGNVGRGVVGDDMPGAVKILVERHRQVQEEGWTPEHDDEHEFGQLSDAAVCYLLRVGNPSFVKPPEWWPWSADWWKPSDDPLRNLVKAGALAAAEIDRLQRKGVGADHRVPWPIDQRDRGDRG